MCVLETLPHSLLLFFTPSYHFFIKQVLPIRLVSNVAWACARLGGFAADTKMPAWAVEQAQRSGMWKAPPQALANLLWVSGLGVERHIKP